MYIKNKRLLFINSDLCSGGAERAMTIIANQFDMAGYDVKMAILRPNKRVYKVNDSIEIIQFKNDARGKLGKMFARIRDIRSTVRKEKPDVTISFTTGNNLITLLSLLGMKTKVVVSERLHPMLTIEGEPIGPISKLKMKLLYPIADQIVFQTPMARDCFTKKSIMDKSIVIPNAVEKSQLAATKGERKKTIVAAGRFSKQKNFEMLIQAFAQFHRSFAEYKLIIYGKGELEDNYRQLTKKLGVEEWVSFPGHVSNLRECLAVAGMYVSSSDFEGISNSMLEALCEGVPSVCTDCPVGGAAMVIENDINGILIPVGDVEGLRDAMLHIASDPKYAERLSRNAINVAEQFATEKIQKIWAGMIDNL